MAQTSNNLPAASSSELPVELLDHTSGDTGYGFDVQPEDLATPWLYVLQSNSPQCDHRGPAYVANAEPGHFLLRGAVDPGQRRSRGPCCDTLWISARVQRVAAESARLGRPAR
jgi:hypothetical protein